MRTVIVALVALASAAIASCGDSLSLEDRPCPCADGWKCCADQNVCVPEAEECPGEGTDTAAADGYGKPCTSLGLNDWACKGQAADYCLIDGPGSTGSGICTYTHCMSSGRSCPASSRCCDDPFMDGLCVPDDYPEEYCQYVDTDPDTTPDTNDSDTDTDDLEGLGDACTAFGTGSECEGKEADFCVYNVPLARGSCSVLCTDLTAHTDCPAAHYCCDFVPKPDNKMCMPEEMWDMVTGATCSNK